MLKSFCASFSCNSMPCSRCSALRGENPNLKIHININNITKALLIRNDTFRIQFGQSKQHQQKNSRGMAFGLLILY